MALEDVDSIFAFGFKLCCARGGQVTMTVENGGSVIRPSLHGLPESPILLCPRAGQQETREGILDTKRWTQHLKAVLSYLMLARQC